VSHSLAVSTAKWAVDRRAWKSSKNCCSRASSAAASGGGLSSLRGTARPVPAREKNWKFFLMRLGEGGGGERGVAGP
jgi:hypothetical protein